MLIQKSEQFQKFPNIIGCCLKICNCHNLFDTSSKCDKKSKVQKQKILKMMRFLKQKILLSVYAIIINYRVQLDKQKQLRVQIEIINIFRKFFDLSHIDMSITLQQNYNALQRQSAISQNQEQKPKHAKSYSDNKKNSTLENLVNKLPLNLFLSPAQYNKLLATNGKNRKIEISDINQGYETNLQFLNDKIFEKINTQRATSRLSLENNLKSSKKTITPCTCCCCQQYCHECEIKRQTHSKMSLYQKNKVRNQIDQQIMKVINKKGKRNSIKKNHKSTKFVHLRRAQSVQLEKKNNRLNQNHQTEFNNSHSMKGKDISHLLIKSLIQFQKDKMKSLLIRKQKQNQKKARQDQLKNFNEKTRMQNIKTSRLQNSTDKIKAPSKSQISKKYWNQVKHLVIDNLMHDNYSVTLKKKLADYHFNLYEHKDLPKRQLKLSKEEIKRLRQKHYEQVKKQIDHKIKQNKNKNKIIERNLKSLQKQRISHLQTLKKVPFHPTQEMINSAFKNIVQSNQTNQKNSKKLTTAKNQNQKAK